MLEVPEGRLHFVSEGSGNPPLVLVHGASGSLDDWAAQIEALRATHHVVACDSGYIFVQACGRRMEAENHIRHSC